MNDYRFSDEFRRHWRVFLCLTIALLVWCAVDVQRRGVVVFSQPDLHKTDFTVYTEAGAAFFDGREPYSVSNIRGWKYLYPPLFALLMAPLHPLSGSVQVTIWFVLCVAMGLGCYIESRRLIAAALTTKWGTARFPHEQSSHSPPYPRGGWGGLVWRATSIVTSDPPLPPPRIRGGTVPDWLIAAAVVAVLFPALNCLQRGQIGIAKLYPLLLGFRMAMLGRSTRDWFLGGIVLALPIVLKITPVLPASGILFLVFLAWFAKSQHFSQMAKRPVGRPFRAVNRVLQRLATARKGRPTIPLKCYAESGAQWTLPRAAWATAGTAFGCLLFFLIVPAGLIGWDDNLRHLDTWYHKVVVRADAVRSDDFGGEVDSPRNQSLFNATYLFAIWLTADPDELEKAKHRDPDEIVERQPLPDFPIVNRIVPVFCGLVLIALLIATIRLGRSADLAGQGAAFGLACVASLIVSPVSRGHYFVLLLPAALFVPLWLIQQHRPRAAQVMALVPAILSVLHYVCLSTAGRMGVLGISITLWFFAACVLLTQSRQASRQEVRLMPFPQARNRAKRAA